jgi:hypothetical protein
VVTVTALGSKRVSIAALIATKPGAPARPRLIYRTHLDRGSGTRRRKSFTEEVPAVIGLGDGRFCALRLEAPPAHLARFVGVTSLVVPVDQVRREQYQRDDHVTQILPAAEPSMLTSGLRASSQS